MWPVLNDPSILAAIIGPLITTLLATGTVGLKSQQSARRADQERARIIGQATQEAAFINSWLSARQQLDLTADARRATDERALADLERVYATIRSVDINTNLRHGSGSLRLVVDATLLIPLQRPWAKVVRVCYYLFTFCSLAFSVATTIQLFENMPRAEAPGYVVGYILVAVLINVIFLLPALGLWGLARALNRPRDPQPGYRSPPTSRGPSSHQPSRGPVS